MDFQGKDFNETFVCKLSSCISYWLPYIWLPDSGAWLCSHVKFDNYFVFSKHLFDQTIFHLMAFNPAEFQAIVRSRNPKANSYENTKYV